MLSVGKRDHCRSEPAVQFQVRAEGARQLPREALGVDLHDEIDVHDRAAQKQVTHGSAHEIEGDSAIPRQAASGGDPAGDVGWQRRRSAHL
jgi:hypothetical protein